VAQPRLPAGAVPARDGPWVDTTGVDARVSDPLFSTSELGHQITHCFLDDDTVDTAERLASVLEKRWASGVVTPRFAAPFHALVPYAWDRFALNLAPLNAAP
jgi:hypothetical protein